MHTHQLTDYKTAALSQRRCHARRRAGCIQVCTLPPSLASSQYSHFPQVLSSRPHGARSAATTRRGRHNNAQTAWRAAGVGESIRRADKGVLTPFRRVNTHLWHRSTRALHANAARPDVRHTAQERRRTSTRRRRPSIPLHAEKQAADTRAVRIKVRLPSFDANRVRGLTWNSSTPCSACRRSTSGCQPQQRRRRGTVLLHMVTTATSKLSGTLPVDWRRTLPGWRCVWCRLIQKMPDNSPNIAARRRLRMDGPDTAGARNGAAARRWPRIRHVDGAASRGWAGCDDGCEYLGTGQVSASFSQILVIYMTYHFR